MPIEQALNKAENVDLKDGVSQKELKDLQNFENVIKKLDFQKADVQEALTNADERIAAVLDALEASNVEGLSDDDKKSISNIKATLGKLYDFKVAEDQWSLGSVDNDDQNVDQTNETVDKTKEELGNVVENAETVMFKKLIEDPSNTDNIHNVFHENQGAYNKLLDFITTSSANRAENPEEHNKAMTLFNAYCKAMGSEVPRYDYLTVGTVKDKKTGALVQGIIAVDNKNPTDPEPRSIAFGADATDKNNPDWLKTKLGQGSAAGNLNALKQEVKGLNSKNFAEGLKGLMEKLSYLGGLIANSLDEFGLFDLPDWVKEKAKSFKEEMLQSQIAPENKDKYTSLSASNGLKEYFMNTYKTSEARNQVLASNDKDFSQLKKDYLASGVQNGVSSDNPVYKKMAEGYKSIDDMLCATSKAERTDLYQKAQLAIKAEADAKAAQKGTENAGDKNSENQSSSAEINVGMTKVLESLKINGLEGKVTLATSETQGQYLEINGMPVALDSNGNGRYISTSKEGESSMFTVHFDRGTNGLTVQPRQILKAMNGSIDTQDAITVSAHLSKMLMSSELSPGGIKIEGEDLSPENKKLYTDTLLAVQKDVQLGERSQSFVQMKEKYSSKDSQVNVLEKQITDLTAEDSPMVPVYLKLQSAINNFFSPKTENTKDAKKDVTQETSKDDKKTTVDQGSPEDMAIESHNSYGDGE